MTGKATGSPLPPHLLVRVGNGVGLAYICDTHDGLSMIQAGEDCWAVRQGTVNMYYSPVHCVNQSTVLSCC
jgi:hypothetical protein